MCGEAQGEHWLGNDEMMHDVWIRERQRLLFEGRGGQRSCRGMGLGGIGGVPEKARTMVCRGVVYVHWRMGGATCKACLDGGDERGGGKGQMGECKGRNCKAGRMGCGVERRGLNRGGNCWVGGRYPTVTGEQM